MTFFFDNNFPKRMVECLRILGVDAVHLQEHFSGEAEDTLWIPHVASQGWIVITSDHRIRRNPAERIVFEKAGLVTFFLFHEFPQRTIWEQCRWIFQYWERIQGQAGKCRAPKSFSVNVNGKFTEY